ncbi:LLM class flavin-dependent oxidoreductase [Ramlibacter rhizophilus]|uniref:LLM class flavin-dependent oxidoreductase n=1 Tax=Ramlibacter rhizophilus TaxID=1781167 RepID=A0A4Z0BH33_9BURK|nr:LLM class flavin-dependent oxidoreductase [Ramlibacter rhizophilus]TFY98615.1 LLM class flavin-dependent oxidoreductase [Ramlibacter rhizophilus]
MPIEFSVIDHLDRQEGVPIHQSYDSRIELVRRYDDAGFTTFLLTEHHFTPLGLAPSPLIFLAAASRVTRRIRLAPLVLILPLYHPLRVASEICMLDHLSHGRLDIGLGRGISPYELAYFNVNHLESREIFEEAQQVLMQALTQDAVSFRGHHFKFFNVPMELKPLQPRLPMWFPCSSPEGARQAAMHGENTCFLAPAPRARLMADAYKQAWAEAGHQGPLPKVAITRHIYVAETDAEARRRGIQAHQLWYQRFGYLWAKFDPRMPAAYDADKHLATGTLIFGSPQTVRARIEEEVAATGANHFVTRFAFGDLRHEESLRSLELFTREVMPRFGAASAEASGSTAP